MAIFEYFNLILINTFSPKFECGRNAGDNGLCGGEREVKVKCVSLPQNAGDLATLLLYKEGKSIVKAI